MKRIFNEGIIKRGTETRGGARKNAGRKAKDASGNAVTVSFCLSPAQKSILDDDIKKSGLSRSAYIQNALFGGVFPHTSA